MNVVVQRARHPQLRDYIHLAVSGLLPFVQKVGFELFIFGFHIDEAKNLLFTCFFPFLQVSNFMLVLVFGFEDSHLNVPERLNL